METPKKKKSAKKHKNKDKHSNVPSSLNHRNSELLPSEHEIIPPPPTISPNNQDLRPLSPDSALASSESSGSSLRKQGKVGLHSQNNNNGLFRIVTYQQFKPVLRKSANIQEKIAIFSRTGQPSSSSSVCNSSTTGKTFPIQRQHGTQIKVLCPAIKLVFISKNI